MKTILSRVIFTVAVVAAPLSAHAMTSQNGSVLKSALTDRPSIIVAENDANNSGHDNHDNNGSNNTGNSNNNNSFGGGK